MVRDQSDNLLLDEDDWLWVSGRLPIVCVDILPVRRTGGGGVADIGLILRESPMGLRWCQLGGRILYRELVSDAVARHMKDSLSGWEHAAISSEPYFVNQYFPQERPGMGVDPRKHAVALCFLAEFPLPVTVAPRGEEALDFRWFANGDLPAEDELWPGTRFMINHPAVQSAPGR